MDQLLSDSGLPSDWTPLHAAVWQHDFDEIRKLANPETVNERDRQGWTPVHLACTAEMSTIYFSQQMHPRDIDPFESSIPRGVFYDLEYDDERATSMGVLELLLPHKPALYHRTDDGSEICFPTPLHCAANSGWLSHARALVEAGAPIDTGPTGSPIHWVSRYVGQDNPVAEYLEDMARNPSLFTSNDVREGEVLPCRQKAASEVAEQAAVQAVQINQSELCDICMRINTDELCGHRGYLHHHSSEQLLISASTCQLCRIMYERLWQDHHLATGDLGQLIVGVSNGNERHGGRCDDPPILRVLDFRTSAGCTCVQVDNLRGRLDFAKCRGTCPSLKHTVDIYCTQETVFAYRERGTLFERLQGYEYPETPLSSTVQTGRDLVTNPSSSQSIGIVNEWFRNCQSMHDRCRETETTTIPADLSFSPSRLIEVTDNGNVRLVLSESHRTRPRYLSLSHRWVSGPMPQWVTRVSNIESRFIWFPIDTLPQSIVDAIRFTRHLGLQYVWIDSLCIVQDSPNGADWKFEAARMGSVYANAEITLSADCAVDDDCGFLTERNNVSISTKVTLPGRDNEVLEINVRQYSDSDYRSRQFSTFSRTVQASYLASRGWIFQERLLSRRILHFGTDQMIWRCKQGIYCEDRHVVSDRDIRECGESETLLSKLSFSHVLEHPIDIADKDFTNKWQRMVEAYSVLELTKPEDKLVAISGLATRLQESASDKQYIAGLWKHCLPQQLAWSTNNSEPKRDHRVWWQPDFTDETGSLVEARTIEDHTFVSSSQLFDRPDIRRAPSFSWASIEGQLVFHDLSTVSATLDEILTDEIEVQNPTKVQSQGALRMTGPLRQVWSFGPFEKDITSLWCPRKAGYIPLYDEEMSPQAYLLPDSKDDRHHSKLYSFKVGEFYENCVFLALLSVGKSVDGTELFRRIGLGRTIGSGHAFFDAAPRVTIAVL